MTVENDPLQTSSRRRTMTIALLADHTELLPTLADWYAREWESYYGVDGPGNAHADLKSRCNKDAMPIGLVALHRNRLRGVVALDVDVATNLTPSVVGLLVAAEYRGQRVAATLLESAASLAGQLGYRRVYISTNILSDHLQRNGWRLFGKAQFMNDEQGLVYVFDLPDSRQ